MTKAEFKRLIRANFDPILTPHGFSCEGSKRCVYWRKVSDEIYHIISPDALRRVDRYDVVVYATSPVIEEDFFDKFPDWVPYTNGDVGYLSPERGVGDYQKLYFCGNPDAFMTSFKRDTAPALANIAVPYLDKIQTMEDLIPTIRPGGMMGAALLRVGRTVEAKRYIESEIKRLSELPHDKLGQVERALAFQRELLAKLAA
jgi:hypothetical protein